MNMTFTLKYSDSDRYDRLMAGPLPMKPVKNFHQLNQPPKGPRKGRR